MAEHGPSKEAIEAGEDKAREWSVCDPSTSIPTEAAKQIVEAAYPFIRADVVREIVELHEGYSHERRAIARQIESEFGGRDG